MGSFVVEVYVGRRGRRELEVLAREAEVLASPPLRYLGSLVLTDDEVCFHVFEGPSPESAITAALAPDRVVETIWIAPRGLERT